MLLLLRGSYLSVVSDRNDPDRVLVRARLGGHIEAIFPTAHVIARPTTQYRYRAFVSRQELGKVLLEELGSMTAMSSRWEPDQYEVHEPYRAIDALMAKRQTEEPFPAKPGDRLAVVRSDGDPKPIREPVEWVPADLELTAEQLDKIRLGILAEQMEDKWFLFFEDPWIHCVRSWTGDTPAMVRVETTEKGAMITGVRVSMSPESGKWTDPREGASIALEAVALLLLGIWTSDPNEHTEEDSLKAWAHHGRAILGEGPRPGVEYKPSGSEPKQE